MRTTVLLLDLEQDALPLSKLDELRYVRVRGVEQAVQALSRLDPPLVVVSRVLSDEEMATLSAAGPDYGLGVSSIVVDRKRPGEELMITSSDRGVALGRPRRAPMHALGDELVRLHREKLPSMLMVLPTLLDVGYYDHVVLDQRKLHVQTEVIGRGSPEVRTTVFEDGTIVATYSKPVADLLQQADEVEPAIRAEHERILEVVRGQGHGAH